MEFRPTRRTLVPSCFAMCSTANCRLPNIPRSSHPPVSSSQVLGATYACGICRICCRSSITSRCWLAFWLLRCLLTGVSELSTTIATLTGGQGTTDISIFMGLECLLQLSWLWLLFLTPVARSCRSFYFARSQRSSGEPGPCHVSC